MARTVARLGEGTRVTDYISLGVVAKTFPLEQVQGILRETGRESIRHRQLPAHVVFYYVIALALFSQVSNGGQGTARGAHEAHPGALQRLRRERQLQKLAARRRAGETLLD